MNTIQWILDDFFWDAWEQAGWTNKNEARRWFNEGWRDPYLALDEQILGQQQTGIRKIIIHKKH